MNLGIIHAERLCCIIYMCIINTISVIINVKTNGMRLLFSNQVKLKMDV